VEHLIEIHFLVDAIDWLLRLLWVLLHWERRLILGLLSILRLRSILRLLAVRRLKRIWCLRRRRTLLSHDGQSLLALD
jgi:hypothetical protein